MKEPGLHPREPERLEALDNLNIMDTISEREFDEITLIASEICNTPIALITLVDSKRQWFKSKIGISASETSKDISFCAHAILQDDVFIIPDPSKDERFFDNPIVTGELHVQFYAGAPILDPITNLPIGTLCVIDNKPRVLEKSQIEALKSLSHQIYKLLELRIKVSSLVAANKKLIFQKAAFDNLSEGVVLQDESGKIVDYNNSALQVLRLSSEQLLGKTSMDPDWRSIHEDGSSFPGDEHPAMSTLATGQSQKNIIMGIQTKTNEIRWLSINSTPLFLSNDTKKPSHAVTTFADVTKERVSQQALLQSAKMTSLGEMSGGVAHEINTPLAIIIAASSQINYYLKSEFLDIEKAAYIAKKIETTAQRISQIVRGLRTFSRDSENDPWQVISIKQIIMDASSLCSEKFKNSQIRFEVDLSSDALVRCIPTQISQVILNLLNNAYDSVLEKSEKWIRISIEKDGDLVRLRITDSGPGIKIDIQAKMMQPFFTTKEVGKGTGLGLSISKGIVETFKGRLCYEDHDKHTSFIVELPIVKTEAE